MPRFAAREACEGQFVGGRGGRGDGRFAERNERFLVPFCLLFLFPLLLELPPTLVIGSVAGTCASPYPQYPVSL